MSEKFKLEPKTVVKDGEVQEIFFSVTVLIDKDDNAQIVDNHTTDYHDFIDTNTIVIRTMILPIYSKENINLMLKKER